MAAIIMISTMTQTTIAISKETKEKLRRFGEKGDTYDQIIEQLAETYEDFLREQYEILSQRDKFKELKFK